MTPAARIRIDDQARWARDCLNDARSAFAVPLTFVLFAQCELALLSDRE